MAEVDVPIPVGIIMPDGITMHFKHDPEETEHPYGVVLSGFGCWTAARFEARTVEEHTDYFVDRMNATLQSFALSAQTAEEDRPAS